MKTRIIAAVALLPLLLVVILALPAVYTAILVGLMAAVGAYEFLWRTKLVKQLRLVVYSVIFATLVPVWCCLGQDPLWGSVGLLAFSCMMFAELLLSKAKLPVQSIALCFVGAILLPYFLSALVRLRVLPAGKFYILIPFVLAFLSDTGAYFAGCALGKHKLAPTISPNKTVEGVVGGVLGAVVGMLLFCLVVDIGFQQEAKYLYALIYGVAGSLAGVFGDLCFSAVKRQTGIKDYGNLIPGHGGVLDRFDSVMIVAPLTEILILLIPVVV